MMRTKALTGFMTAALVLLVLPETPVAIEMSEYETELIKRLEIIEAETTELMRKYAEKGDKTARCHFGLRLALGKSGNQDYGFAAKYLVGLNQESCRFASALKGLMYRDGLGVKKDLEKSKFWFRRMALQLRLKTVKREDFFLPGGADVTKEIKAAQAWRERLFENADPQMQYEEALKFLSGDGVIADPDIAHDLLRKAIVAENPEAMYQLGKGYLSGIFQFDDSDSVSDALAWLSLAARRGVVAAQKDLAVWYATHATRQRDNFKAYFWLRSAKLTKADLGPLAAEITRRVSDTEKGVVERMLERNSFP